jgi:hypothetical protein
VTRYEKEPACLWHVALLKSDATEEEVGIVDCIPVVPVLREVGRVGQKTESTWCKRRIWSDGANLTTENVGFLVKGPKWRE